MDGRRRRGPLLLHAQDLCEGCTVGAGRGVRTVRDQLVLADDEAGTDVDDVEAWLGRAQELCRAFRARTLLAAYASNSLL